MRDFLHLFINGEEIRVSGNKAFMTLSDFLREKLALVGTKIVCSEGDCGACSVLVGRQTNDSRSFVYRSLDSCIAFLYQLDRTHIVTVEGLGGDANLSAIQNAMVRCHGSQCGYCTPGFITTIHGLFEENRDGSGSDRSDQILDEETLRVGLSGNLCRCTGYVQIIEAAQSISPSDVERIGDLYPAGSIVEAFESVGGDDVQVVAKENGLIKTVYLPRTFDQAVAFKSKYTGARIVTGATDVGVQSNHGHPVGSTILSMKNVGGIAKVETTENEIVIGSGASWTQVLDHVREIYPEFADILLRFGSPQIRNMGSVAGNLANASPIADCIPFLYVIDAKLVLASSRGRRVVDVKNFYQGYKQTDLQVDELIESIHCPRPKPNEILKLCKVSKRRDMDISTFTAAMRLTMSGNTIVTASVALGGVGPTVIRATRSESALIGMPLTLEVMRTAGVAARSEIHPISDVRGSEFYRGQLAENIFVKWFHELSGSQEAVLA